ncbi:hypothetical protein F4804DRAFT_330307 [Jackrogersella minutella]|nr:hypothetical protein F4804DRAFT_330307 [Jackrogersella minutella]
MDVSSFAIFESPALIFVYTGLTLYLALCFNMGFKISRARWGSQPCCLLPAWATLALLGSMLSIIFAVVIVPYAFVMAVWTGVAGKVKDRHRQFTRWRRRRRGEVVEEEESAAGTPSSGSWTTIEDVIITVPVGSPVGYGHYYREHPGGVDLAHLPPQRPVPAHIERRGHMTPASI